MEDAEDVVSVCNAGTLKVQGIREHTVERRRTHWQRSGFRLATDTRIVEDAAGRPIAYAVINDMLPHERIRGDYYVSPLHDVPALREVLLDWLEYRARQSITQAPEGSRVVITHHILAQDKSRKELLLTNGYKLVHHSLRMRVEMTEPPIVIVPDGISIRSLDREKDLPSTSRTIQEAFRNHWGFVERNLDDDVARYEQWLNDDPSIDPAVWHLACANDDVVGVCLGTTRYSGDEDQAYIFTLGVRDAWRRRGIGRGLLLHAFAMFYKMERRFVGLDVDTINLTGALRLYESVGMRTLWQIDEYEKELQSGSKLAS